jgi:hypothetical protein
VSNCFSRFWATVQNTLYWLIREDYLYFGEIELLHGEHGLALPLWEYGICTAEIREVWVSVDDRKCHIPVCCGSGQNWFSVKIVGDEVRIDAEVNTDKVLLKWFILV